MKIIFIATFLVISFLITKFRIGQRQFANKFNPEITTILAATHAHASKFNTDRIGVDMILYCIVKNEIGIPFQILKNSEFKASEFMNDAESGWIKQYSNQKPTENIRLTREAEKCLVKTLKIAGEKRKDMAGSTDLLVALTLTKSLLAVQNKYQTPTISSLNSAIEKYDSANIEPETDSGISLEKS